MRAARTTLVLSTLLLLAPPCLASLAGDGRMGVLYISDPVRAQAFDFMRAEPIFTLTFVAASLRGFGGWDLDDVHRAIRLYMPRTYQDLASGYDVIVLDNANRDAMTIGNIELLAKGARDAGLGLLMTGGWESFGGTGTSEPPWGQTAVGQLLPTEDVENTWVMGGRMVILEEDQEFVSSIPWERKAPFMISWHHNLVGVRPGAELLAITDKNTYQYGGEEHPLFITWELGGRIFACTGEIAQMAIYLSYGGVNYVPWDYYGDFISNMMIYLSRRPVPQDVDLVHAVRSKAVEIRTRSSLLLSLLEFIESFGANTQALMADLDGLNEQTAESTEAYIELRFEDVLEAYGEVLGILDQIEVRAVELKDRALLWVYVIEWLAVSGTCLGAGFFLWTIMVRRRLYRDVRVTKFVD